MAQETSGAFGGDNAGARAFDRSSACEAPKPQSGTVSLGFRV